jgi:hypothetical protein
MLTPPKIGDRAQRLVFAVHAHAFLHLRRELAGRHEDQATNCPSCAFFIENLEQGQREAGGLAGARLCGGKQILACEHHGNGLRLDGGGNGIALLLHSTEQLGRKAKGIERRRNGISPERSAWEGLNLQPVQAETT